MAHHRRNFGIRFGKQEWEPHKVHKGKNDEILPRCVPDLLGGREGRCLLWPRREQVSILKPQQARCHLEAAVHGEDTALRVSPKGRTKRIAQLCPGISKARCATALYTNHGFHGTGAHRDRLGS